MEGIVYHVDVIPLNIENRAAGKPVDLLSAEESSKLNPAGFVESIVWGWKRDQEQPRLSRTIYFSGRLALSDTGVQIESPFFFYAHWGNADMMQPVVAQVAAISGWTDNGSAACEALHPAPGILLIRIIAGRPQPSDIKRLRALASRNPDYPMQTPPTVPTSNSFDLRRLGVVGCDLLAGSGLSYEAGLPMLKEVHDLFYVDDGDEGFCLGAKDQLPGLFMTDMERMFRRFSGWHVQAATCRPSRAHRYLIELHRAKFIHNVYTDNVDELFAVAGFDGATKVRGSGVVNEFFPVEFHPQSNALLVVGVSADRRGIIAQARTAGLKIVVVNPYLAVSPGAKNLDYLQDGDIYFRLPAGEALPQIVAASLNRIVAI